MLAPDQASGKQAFEAFADAAGVAPVNWSGLTPDQQLMWEFVETTVATQAMIDEGYGRGTELMSFNEWRIWREGFGK